MSTAPRHFGRKLPIPSTIEILRELLKFSAAEEAKRRLNAEGNAAIPDEREPNRDRL